MSDSRILWRTNRKLSGLVIDAPISQKAGALRNKFESCRVRHLLQVPIAKLAMPYALHPIMLPRSAAPA
jgi:hypothetical protein